MITTPADKIDFWNLLRKQEQQQTPPPKPEVPPVKTSSADMMANALSNPSPAMNALFAVPHPDLQRMAGDVVPMNRGGQMPMKPSLMDPGALGLAARSNQPAVNQLNSPYVGPTPGTPQGEMALRNIAGQDIANGRIPAPGSLSPYIGSRLPPKRPLQY